MSIILGLSDNRQVYDLIFNARGSASDGEISFPPLPDMPPAPAPLLAPDFAMEDVSREAMPGEFDSGFSLGSYQDDTSGEAAGMLVSRLEHEARAYPQVMDED
jgi:hypothetical protein